MFYNRIIVVLFCCCCWHCRLYSYFLYSVILSFFFYVYELRLSAAMLLNEYDDEQTRVEKHLTAANSVYIWLLGALPPDSSGLRSWTPLGIAVPQTSCVHPLFRAWLRQWQPGICSIPAEGIFPFCEGLGVDARSFIARPSKPFECLKFGTFLANFWTSWGFVPPWCMRLSLAETSNYLDN